MPQNLASSPESARKERGGYHKFSCQSCYDVHRRCNRDWNNDAKCSNCDTLGTPCLRRERNSGSHESGSRNQDNTAGTSTRSEVHSGNSNQNRRARQQQYSPKHDTAQEISQGISEVNHHIPGILGEGISTEGLRNQLSNDERVSPMLDRVLRLFGASSAKANGPRERVLLDEAKQAYGLESEEPTLATIKATFLLSSWLSEWKPVYAENLLDNAYEWLSSHNRHEQLKYVPSHEIHQLLDRVLAFAREKRFGLRIRCNHERTEPLSTASPRRQPGTQLTTISTRTSPTLRVGDMGIVPSEQVDSTSPPLYHLAQSMSPPPPPAHTSYQPPFRGQRRPAPVPANIAGSAPAPVPPTPAASFTEKVPTYTENVYPNHPRDPGPLNGTTQQLTFDQSMVNTGFYFSDYMQIPMPPTTYLQRPPPSGCLPQPAQISGPSFVMPASNPYQQQNRPVANNPRAQTLTSYIPMDEVQLIGYPSAPQMPYNSGRAIGRNGTGNRNFHG